MQVCGSRMRELIYDELVRKRNEHVKYMKEGLQLMKVLQFIEAFPILYKTCFVNMIEKTKYHSLLNEIVCLLQKMNQSKKIQKYGFWTILRMHIFREIINITAF